MLKDSYTWTVPKNCCLEVRDSLHYRIGSDSTRLYALCLLNLERVSLKLIEAAHRPGLKGVKLRLNKREALAFHFSYQQGYLNNDDVFVKELFTAIDKTI